MAVGMRDERGYSQILRPQGSTVVRQSRRAEWLANQCHGASQVVELGCGLGDMAAAVAKITKADVLGVDLSPKFVAEAQKRHTAPNLSFAVLDILDGKSFADGSTDMVIGNGILHHLIPDLAAVLRRLKGVVRPGGGIAFIEPNLRHPLCRLLFQNPVGRCLAKLEPQEMAFLAEPLTSMLHTAGFHQISVEPRDFLLPGLPRFVERPTFALERRFEHTRMGSYAGQSLFITARTVPTTRSSDVTVGR